MSIPVVTGFHTNFHQYSEHYGLRWLQAPVLRYLRRFHNRTSATLVPTEKLRNELLAQNFERVEVVGRGVDTQLFSPVHRDQPTRMSWGLDEQDIAVIVVGRVAPEKNIPLAIRAFRAMSFHRENMRLVIVGDGPNLEQLHQQNPDIIFAGEQRGESLARLYASADILLFPSETETFGNVLLEGMASGLAVVAFDYAAAHIHVQARENGIVVPLGEAQDFIREAIALTESPDLRQHLKTQARIHAQGVSWRRIIDQFERILLSDSVNSPKNEVHEHGYVELETD